MTPELERAGRQILVALDRAGQAVSPSLSGLVGKARFTSCWL